MKHIRKYVAIGPESTGKSTLCMQLAAHYNTRWCPAYARAYLETNGTDYSYDDLLTIAQGQLNLEDDLTAQTANSDGLPLLFVDTDMYVMKVWCEFVFGRCHRFILDEIVQRPYDLYLLCNTDLPWGSDKLREYPDLKTREALFRTYKDLLINQNTPWVEIKGLEDQRLQMGIHAVKNIL